MSKLFSLLLDCDVVGVVNILRLPSILLIIDIQKLAVLGQLQIAVECSNRLHLTVERIIIFYTFYFGVHETLFYFVY